MGQIDLLVLFLYAGLLVFALNGLVMYKMTSRRIELKRLEEDVLRKMFKLHVNKLRGRK